jgi:type VI secretion system protein ImpC
MPDTAPAAPAAVALPAETRALLDTIVREGNIARTPAQEEYASKLVSEFAVQKVEKQMVVGDNVIAAIKTRIEEIDNQISEQLQLVLHAPEFQKLEGSWRGLRNLVFNTQTGNRIKLRLLNATQKDLKDDLEMAVEVDQSNLFKKIYEEEYGTFGGYPYSFLVADFQVGRSSEDVKFIRNLSQVAAAAHAPVIAAASPQLFDLGSFEQLGTPRDLAKIFDSLEMAEWRDFRRSEDSRYVALVLPRVLLRLPYGPGPDNKPVDGLNFKEEVTGPDHDKYLWGNASYVLAERITSAFAQYGWCAAIRGVEGGGKVERLPFHKFNTKEGDVAVKCPTEVTITDRREKELSDLGFISLCHCKGETFAAFFGGATAQKPNTDWSTNEANANARISAVLPYVLAASRFAHYLKVMVRDKIGSFQSKEDLSKFLNTWLATYVLLTDSAPQSQKASFPLREGRVDVAEDPARPGSFTATVFLRPHFQLEELTASIRLVATLPPPAA